MRCLSRTFGATAPGGAGVFLVAWVGFGGFVASGGASGAGFGWIGLRFGLYGLSIGLYGLSICFVLFWGVLGFFWWRGLVLAGLSLGAGRQGLDLGSLGFASDFTACLVVLCASDFAACLVVCVCVCVIWPCPFNSSSVLTKRI